MSYTNEYAVRLRESTEEAERDTIVRDFERASPSEREAAKTDFEAFLLDDRDTREDNNIRSYAAVFLGLIGGDDVYEFLIERLHEEENDVVLKWIVKVLVERFDDERRFEELWDQYRREQGGIIFARQVIVGAVAEAEARASRAEAEGRTEDARADEIGPFGRKILLEAATDLYWEVRVPAIRALGRMAERSAVLPLIRLLRDPAQAVGAVESRTDRVVTHSERAQIIDALAEIGDIRAVPAVLEVLGRKEEALSVRRAAVDALGELGVVLRPGAETSVDRDTIVGALIGEICEADRVVAYTATDALQKVLGDERAARRLAEHGLLCEEEKTLDRVADAIRLLDPTGAVEHLQDMRNEERESALRRLVRAGDGGEGGPGKGAHGGTEGEPGTHPEPQDQQGFQERSRRLISRIGGQYALEVLYQDTKSQITQWISNGLVGLLLVAGGWFALRSVATFRQILGAQDGGVGAGGQEAALFGGAFLLAIVLTTALYVLARRVSVRLLRYLGVAFVTIAAVMALTLMGGGVLTTLAEMLPGDPAGAGSEAPTRSAMLAVGSILSLFLASILLAFPARMAIRPLRYLISVILAFLFSVGMVFTLTIGLWWLNEIDADANSGAAEGEQETHVSARAFGPVTVHRVPPEGDAGTWVVSLSAALPRGASSAGDGASTGTPAQTPASVSEEEGEGFDGGGEQEADTVAVGGAEASEIRTDLDISDLGFAAPLWVVLLATIGAGLLTVALVVKELIDRPDFANQDEMRRRLGQIVQHQFFIFFAPVGAIFVYQGLVAIGADRELLTVAVAALGAGATINLLLERAVRSSARALRRDEERGSAEARSTEGT